MQSISIRLFRRAVLTMQHPLFAVLVVAAVLRIAFFLQTRNEPTFTVPLWDSAVYDEMARSVARGNGIGDPKAYFFGPLYPYALGFVYALTDSCTSCAVLLQHALGVLVVGLTYVWSRFWFARAESLLAATLIAISGVQIFYEGKLLMEVGVSALLLGSLVLVTYSRPNPGHPTENELDRARSDQRRRLALAGLAGLGVGLAALGRPTLLVVVPLGLFFLRPSRQMTLSLAACFLLAALFPPSAALVRNFRSEGVVVPITASGGFNFYLGNTQSAEGSLLDHLRIQTDSSWNGQSSAEIELGRSLDSGEVSRYWFQRTLGEIGKSPEQWSVHYVSKVHRFLSGQDIPQIEFFTFERSRIPLLRLLPVGLHLLMAGAVAGMILLWPNRRVHGLLYGSLGLYVLATAAFLVTTRYRIVAMPYFSIFAATFAMEGIRAVRRRNRKRVIQIVALAIVSVVFTWPGWYSVDEARQVYAQHLHDGFRLARTGYFDRAAEAYRRGQALWPEDYESYLCLGIALREQGRLDSSLRQLKAAVQRNQVDAEVPYHLGVTLHKSRRFEEAERALRKSLQMDPRRALTHAYLGVTLAAQGSMSAAKTELTRSLELDPTEPFTHNNLGALLGAEGNHTGARDSFVRALDHDPSYVPARRNLAQFYLERGRNDAAVRELRRVLLDAPTDSSAARLLRSVSNLKPS